VKSLLATAISCLNYFFPQFFRKARIAKKREANICTRNETNTITDFYMQINSKWRDTHRKTWHKLSCI